jgi:hypothetical protein
MAELPFGSMSCKMIQNNLFVKSFKIPKNSQVVIFNQLDPLSFSFSFFFFFQLCDVAQVVIIQ